MNHTQPTRMPQPRYRWPHPLWLWLGAALLLLLALILWSHSAAAQNQRSFKTMIVAISAQPDLAKGKTVYRRQCASCHGRSAFGKERSLTPALAGQVAAYTIKQLVDIGEGDRPVVPMHRALATPELLNPATLANVAGYLAMLKVNRRAQKGDGRQLSVGAKIYGSTCVGCHGLDGSGNAAWFVPSLRGQHYSYLLTQMRQLATSHRYAVEPDVIQLLEMLSLEQLSAVADVASRLAEESGSVAGEPKE